MEQCNLEQMTLGQRVRYIREQRGLSSSRLARAMEVSENTVSNVENGRTTYLLPHNLRRMAEVLQVPESLIQNGVMPTQQGDGEWPPVDVEAFARSQGIKNPEHLEYIRRTFALFMDEERKSKEGGGTEPNES